MDKDKHFAELQTHKWVVARIQLGTLVMGIKIVILNIVAFVRKILAILSVFAYFWFLITSIAWSSTYYVITRCKSLYFDLGSYYIHTESLNLRYIGYLRHGNFSKKNRQDPVFNVGQNTLGIINIRLSFMYWEICVKYILLPIWKNQIVARWPCTVKMYLII